MGKVQILVVEDEKDLAKLIQRILNRLGYGIAAVVDSGEDAIKAAEKTFPDLVLMDIKLKGEMDGIEAAELIRTRFNIPVVYVTAFTNDTILQRAKISEPFGYLVKPFKKRELQTTIEMALFKHKEEEKLKKSERRLATIIRNIGDGLIVMNQDWNITTFNLAAEQLFGYLGAEILGKPLRQLLPKKELATIIVERAQEVEKYEADLQMRRKDGSHFPARIHVSTFREVTAKPSAYIVVVRDLSEKKDFENLRNTLSRTKELLEKIRRLLEREISLVVTYMAVGPITLVNNSRLSEKELYKAVSRGFTLLMSGIDYRKSKQTKYAGIIEIPDSEYFTLCAYRMIEGSIEDIQSDSRLKTTVIMFLLVMRKQLASFILQKFLEIEEFLAAETGSWKRVTDLTETELETFHEKIQGFILNILENQREELLEQLAEDLLD